MTTPGYTGLFRWVYGDSTINERSSRALAPIMNAVWCQGEWPIRYRLASTSMIGNTANQRGVQISITPAPGGNGNNSYRGPRRGGGQVY